MIRIFFFYFCLVVLCTYPVQIVISGTLNNLCEMYIFYNDFCDVLTNNAYVIYMGQLKSS